MLFRSFVAVVVVVAVVARNTSEKTNAMPRYNNVLAGLAVLALAFATGAEAVVCNADHYLEMDGAYVSGSAANAPKCTPCPSNMKNPAGVTGGYGDSAAPRYAANVAAAVAATSADNKLLTWCNVPEGYYLSTATSDVLPGAVTVCPTAATTGVAQTISGTVTIQSAAVQCLGKSTCAADKYLELNGAYTASPSVANALQCTACPPGMTAPATPVVTVAAAKIAHTGIAATSAKTEVITNCNVPAGYYLSTATSSTSPGAVTACPAAFNGQATTGIEQIIPPTTVVAVQTPFSHCIQKSTCAADQYLKNSGGHVAGGGGVVSQVYAKSTVTTGASAKITLGSHGFTVNQKLRYNQNGVTRSGHQLMTPLTEGQLVFVKAVSGDDVTISAVKGGDLIAISNAGDDLQSFTPDFTVPKASITKATGSIELDIHGFAVNQQLIYQQDGAGTLAAPLTDGQIVFIKTRSDGNNFIISATKGGDAITFTSQGHDTQKFTPVYANPPQCNDCPAGMTAPAAPDVSSKAALIYAAAGSGAHTANSAPSAATGSGDVDDKMITFCNVPAGSWLSANVVDQLATGSSPGAVTSCLDDSRFLTTTSPAVPVTAAVSADANSAISCTKISNCAANE